MREPVSVPDLSERPFHLSLERVLAASPRMLFAAWTRHFDRWFAAPGSMLMDAKVDGVFFFETVYQVEGQGSARRHPHYGRFLRLEPERLLELTWVTGKEGTQGAETVVRVELTPLGEGTRMRLTHAGFLDSQARDQHERAWPVVLAHLDAVMKETAALSGPRTAAS